MIRMIKGSYGQGGKTYTGTLDFLTTEQEDRLIARGVAERITTFPPAQTLRDTPNQALNQALNQTLNQAPGDTPVQNTEETLGDNPVQNTEETPGDTPVQDTKETPVEDPTQDPEVFEDIPDFDPVKAIKPAKGSKK